MAKHSFRARLIADMDKRLASMPRSHAADYLRDKHSYWTLRAGARAVSAPHPLYGAAPDAYDCRIIVAAIEARIANFNSEAA